MNESIVNFRHVCLALVCVGLFASCSIKPRGHYQLARVPAAPDYADSSNWAALPWVADAADLLPSDTMHDVQPTSRVDVFFIHPTIYNNGPDAGRGWNADLQARKLNREVDRTTIKYQASIFNGVGRIYAPRYRQAHLVSFFTKRRKKDADQALALAYADVKASFEYYLSNYNDGRPFIIAGHSQGALHAKQLLKEFVESKPLADQFIAAYIVGYPVAKDEFKILKPCERPEETGCFTTWRTYRRDFAMRKAVDTNVICTNPLSWKMDNTYVPKSENKGAVLRRFHTVFPQICDAEVYRGVLAVSKPKFPGSVFFVIKNYHPGDFNLFYFDVRANAKLRSEWYFARNK
jgi:Protein of unknown function (DUF3089)